MTETAERLKAEIAKLPVHERAALAQFLIESLDEGIDDTAESDWDAEDEAIAYYERQQTGLGLVPLFEVERAFDNVRQHPDRWPIYKM